MTLISKFYGIGIRLICAPALGPRISAIYQNSELIVDIANLRVLDGTSPARVRDMVLEWARSHREELLESWTRCRGGHGPLLIEPLT